MGELRLPQSDRGNTARVGFRSECLSRPDAMPQPPDTPPVPAIARVDGAVEHNVEIDGLTWRYLTAGSGPPLLLIHGFMGYSYSWRFNLGPLSQHFSVWALDLPGCGFS